MQALGAWQALSLETLTPLYIDSCDKQTGGFFLRESMRARATWQEMLMKNCEHTFHLTKHS